jgi:ankyrin repeat protein
MIGLAAGMNPMDTDNFIEALIDGDLEAAARFSDAGSRVNAHYEPFGWTPLHYAVEHGVLTAVQWLLERGANVNARDNSGWTPLHLSIDSEGDLATQRYVVHGSGGLSDEVTKLLLQNGADANARTDRGKTPLALARSYGHQAAIEALTKRGQPTPELAPH